MGTIIIEVDENINLKIKTKTLEEAIDYIKNVKYEKKFKAVKLKTKDFKEAESR
ncbi:hypothetical protein [Persephonella sp.]